MEDDEKERRAYEEECKAVEERDYDLENFDDLLAFDKARSVVQDKEPTEKFKDLLRKNTEMVLQDFDKEFVNSISDPLFMFQSRNQGDLPDFSTFMRRFAMEQFVEKEADAIDSWSERDPVFKKAVEIGKIPAKGASDEESLLRVCFDYDRFLLVWFMSKDPDLMAKWARLFHYHV